MLPKPPEPEESLNHFWEVTKELLSGSFWDGVGVLLGLIALLVSLSVKVKTHDPQASWSSEGLACLLLWLRMVLETLVRISLLALFALPLMAGFEWCWHAVTGQYANTGAEKVFQNLEVTKYQITRHIPLVALQTFGAISILLVPAAIVARHSHCRRCCETNMAWIAGPATVLMMIQGGIRNEWKFYSDAAFIRIQLRLPESCPPWLVVSFSVLLMCIGLIFCAGLIHWYLCLATKLYAVEEKAEK